MRILTVILVTLITASLSFAQDISRQQAQKEKLEREIALIDKQIATTQSKQKQGVNSLLLTRQKLEARARLISEIQSEINQYDRAIRSTSANITRLNNRMDTLVKYHTSLVRGAYKTKDNKTLFAFLLSSKDINQAMRRWSYMKNISAMVEKQADDIRRTKADLEAEKEKLSDLRARSMATRSELVKERQTLATEERRLNSVVAQLSKQERTLKRDLQAKQKQVEALNKEIERILAEAVRQQKSGKGPKVDYALSARFENNRGKLPWPVEGVVIQKFGQSFHPVFKNLKLPYNNGINISAQAGSDAHTVFNGVVKQILVMPGYDQCVLIQHGEYFTFYCKLKTVYVKAGDNVSTGDRIGRISTNDSGNSELHFQLWKGTTKQNPEKWLR